jgi:phosphoribosylformylglycinamidine (FGAM) synthase-like enzyme
VVSVGPEKVAAVLAITRQCGVAARAIGHVTQNADLRIQYEGSTVVDSPVETLRDVWAHSLERTLRVQ